MTEGELYALAEDLGRSWSEPRLTSDLAIEFSPRLTRTLGRCLPDRRTVRLSTQLREAPTELVREVLCHELAHVVAHERFGPDIRPHGEEWCSLVREAGYRPRRRMPWVIEGEAPSAASRPRALYEHRCPVCQMVRVARTATARWRCADCVADGLDGELTVTRIPAATHDEVVVDD